MQPKAAHHAAKRLKIPARDFRWSRPTCGRAPIRAGAVLFGSGFRAVRLQSEHETISILIDVLVENGAKLFGKGRMNFGMLENDGTCYDLAACVQFPLLFPYLGLFKVDLSLKSGALLLQLIQFALRGHVSFSLGLCALCKNRLVS